jgi:CRP-like cAMP-binding protein
MSQPFQEIIPTGLNKRFIKKRTTLYYQGEIPRHGFLLVKGIVKQYSISSIGEEQIVSFHADNELFPLPWIFNQTSSTLAHYETVTDCELLTFDKSEFLKALDDDPKLQRVMLDHFANNYTSLLMRIRALEQSQALEKIMFTLYYLLRGYGKEMRDGKYLIQLDLTHATIASLVGLTRETTTTRLNQLKRHGIINYHGHEYTIDKEKIEQRLGEDTFKDLIR